MSADPTLLPAYVLSNEIMSGRLSPVDLMEAHLARIERLDPKLHAFIEVYGPQARLAAQGANKAIRSGHVLGPFHGVPIAVKDIIDIEGKVTTGGSATRLNHLAVTTATVVRRLIGQGMIVLGKTHTVEFACGAWGTNQHMGTPWNPWDKEVARTPGGSSSGSAVAVAARLAPWALGTDTGCSVRQPAAWCGITGLKTSIGRISTHGILPLSTTLDTPGAMARTVRDVALLYEVLQGPDSKDKLTIGHPVSDVMSSLEGGVRGLRLARLPGQEREGVDREVLQAYDQSLKLLEGMGAQIVDIALPFPLEIFLSITNITMGEAYFFNKAVVEDPGSKMDDFVRRRLLSGANVSAHDYLETLRHREEMKRQMNAAMKGIDAFLTPSTQTAAIAIDQVDQKEQPTRFQRFVNLLDLCALSLPNGFTNAGLPLSLQIVCQAYQEDKALRIGYAYQKATTWHERLPPVI
jgi:aspartyl-tRNA(Asn)/glutamyl-tRNA(Gln) amidotransferase subunit A